MLTSKTAIDVIIKNDSVIKSERTNFYVKISYSKSTQSREQIECPKESPCDSAC
jgi:hypothetical protein